jgi:hypothetical protein
VTSALNVHFSLQHNCKSPNENNILPSCVWSVIACYRQGIGCTHDMLLCEACWVKQHAACRKCTCMLQGKSRLLQKLQIQIACEDDYMVSSIRMGSNCILMLLAMRSMSR